MTRSEIFNALLEHNYTEKQSSILASKLAFLDESLIKCMENWFKNGQQTNYSAHDISIKELVEKHNMQYLAAVLTMDWVLRDPTKAIDTIRKGVR